MREALINTAATAVDMARKAGAAHVFATATTSRDTEVRIRDQVLEKAQASISQGLSLRIWVDGRYSQHNTSDLREATLGDFIADAVALTRALEPDPHRVVPDPALFTPLPSDDLDLVDGAVDRLTTEDRVAALTRIEASSRAHPKVISATASAWDNHNAGALVGSNGFSGTWAQTSAWMGVEVTLRDEGDRRPQGGSWMGGRHLSAVPSPESIGQDALDRVAMRLGAKKGPTIKTTLIVEPRAAGRLLNALLGPANARSVQQGQSFWANLKGTAAFSKALSIWDEPLLKRGLASRHFDGEGIAARRLPLIEAGVAGALYVDTYYGSKLGLAPTTGSPSNRVMGLGNRDMAALVSAAGTGILVDGWLGGNNDGTTGDFSLGCQGRLIEGGQITASVGEMNITGNLRQLFQALSEVGNDPWPYGAIASPTLVFEGVQFSGA